MEHIPFLGKNNSDQFVYVLLLNPFLLCNVSSEFFWDDGRVSHFWMVGAFLDVLGMWSDSRGAPKLRHFAKASAVPQLRLSFR